ncbi:methyltransferase domain-containing protein [Nonomuraea phyllanthi]|uniref:Methyltransferase domain-containing protein n=1 Tax=Nonomuraea phyllanthi TaxID=2219224 RepID=A0A5C4VDU9_9ACTN|nr:class I SAM-dependent methyltransferase [Nonomuraea phyllanthi]KAB8188588.1 methyltransferase domain-containing protein [Nonomuraea phyllanthi]QFY13367.1 methyltransferase domain-containing protein [Nonomuraea phyllanthi]
MATDEIQSWAYDEPIRSPFALPRGALGRLAGRLMLWLNDPGELVTLIGKQGSVLEVGCGPGGLLRHIDADRVCGIDPSPDMLQLAARHNRGRDIDLRLGTAADTGHPDRSFDVVVSVNNVAMWPDLEAGVRELRRVTRPRGRLLIAWHSATGSSPIARKNSLAEEKLARIAQALGEPTRRHELRNLTVFERRCPG